MQKHDILWAIVAFGMASTSGLLIPILFEWGLEGSARSPDPQLERAVLLVVSLTVIATLLAFKFLPSQGTSSAIDVVPRQQFSLKFLFACLTTSAIFTAILPQLNPSQVRTLIVACTAVSLVAAFRHSMRVGVRFLTLLSVLFMPFCWIIRFNRPFGSASGLYEGVTIGPGILAISAFGKNVDDIGWAGIAVVVQMAIGLALAFRGRRLFFCYRAALLLASSVQSLLMHAGYRV